MTNSKYVCIGMRHPKVELILHSEAQCKRWAHQNICERVYVIDELEELLEEWNAV